jgi:hypothetical protein
LANDKIVNVRISLGEVLKRHLDRKGAMSNSKKLLEIV